MKSYCWWWRVKDRQADPKRSLRLGDTYPLGVHETADIDETAIIRGDVFIGEGAKVDAYAIIEGPVVIAPKAIIGTFAKVRAGSYIGRGVLVGSYTEVKATCIESNASIGHHCYLGDSHVQEGAHLGGSVRVCNMRFRGEAVKVKKDDTLIDTGMDKLGCFIGAYAWVGSSVVIMPGRYIPEGAKVLPNTVYRGGRL